MAKKSSKSTNSASTVTASERVPLPVRGKASKADPQALRAKAALAAIDQIKSRYGEGSIMKLGEAKRVDIDAVPTGSISLDIALGVAGVPKGRIIEIYGPESSGKTTLAQHIVASVQKKRWHRCVCGC